MTTTPTTTPAVNTSVWETMETVPTSRQKTVVRYLTATLVDLVVLCLFAEYWKDYVVISSFTIALLAAVLLQVLLKLTLLVEHKVAAYFNASPEALRNSCATSPHG